MMKDKNLELKKIWAGRIHERIDVKDFSLNEIIQIKSNNTKPLYFILSAPCDLGVVRNKGRRGANFGPCAIINQLKLMARSENLTDLTHINVLNPPLQNDASQKNFDAKQIAQKNNIETIFKNCFDSNNLFVHLGGGHDHIYPLLMALDKSCSKKIAIINIDAHLDTRTDPIFHSGTPFRQFDHNTHRKFSLIQMGIHQFANPKSNYTPLKNTYMKIVSKKELEKENDDMEFLAEVLNKVMPEVIQNPEDYTVVLSLDADAICSSQMEAVSAPNHDGINFKFIGLLLSQLKKLNCYPKILGIYEYNPLYDNLNNKGARMLAAFIHQYFVSNCHLPHPGDVYA